MRRPWTMTVCLDQGRLVALVGAEVGSACGLVCAARGRLPLADGLSGGCWFLPGGREGRGGLQGQAKDCAHDNRDEAAVIMGHPGS